MLRCLRAWCACTRVCECVAHRALHCPNAPQRPATTCYDLLFPLPLLMVLPLPLLCPCANACQIAKLMPGTTPPDRSAGDECGYAVGLDAITGTLVMGCPGHNRVAQDAGVIVVYLWNGAAWVEHQTVYNERSVKEDRCVRGDEGSVCCSCCCSPLKLAPTASRLHPKSPWSGLWSSSPSHHQSKRTKECSHFSALCCAVVSRFGSVIALDNDIMVTASPNARYRDGEVYIYRKPAGPITSQYFVLDQVSLCLCSIAERWLVISIVALAEDGGEGHVSGWRLFWWGLQCAVSSWSTQRCPEDALCL